MQIYVVWKYFILTFTIDLLKHSKLDFYVICDDTIHFPRSHSVKDKTDSYGYYLDMAGKAHFEKNKA